MAFFSFFLLPAMVHVQQPRDDEEDEGTNSSGDNPRWLFLMKIWNVQFKRKLLSLTDILPFFGVYTILYIKCRLQKKNKNLYDCRSGKVVRVYVTSYIQENGFATASSSSSLS